jgi:hypothetical protein
MGAFLKMVGTCKHKIKEEKGKSLILKILNRRLDIYNMLAGSSCNDEDNSKYIG